MLFNSFLFFLAKPKLIGEENTKKLVRLETDVTLRCPFENFDSFTWFKDSRHFQSIELDINLRNISTTDEGIFFKYFLRKTQFIQT